MKVTKITRGGPGGGYRYTYLPTGGGKIKWDGEERNVERREGLYRTKLPFDLDGWILWVRANPLLLHQVEERWPRPWWLVSIDDEKWIALLLPSETRRVGREAFWAPREIRRHLQDVFREGYYEETEVEKIGNRYVERVKAIYVSDHYASYEVQCPFCGEPQRIETLNELQYEGECTKCGALIYFEPFNSLCEIP